MKWIKASERLPVVPQGTSRSFHCRNLRYGNKSVLYFGKSSSCLLVRQSKEWEWLDEDFETDYTMGFNDCKNLVKQKINNISL